MSEIYERSARVYDALCRHKDYAGASATLCAIVDRFSPGASTLLDVGCGTGLHLSHLGTRFVVEGLDLSPEMLDIARARCPGVRLHQGSLVEFDLGKRFDVVTCLFGSIAYARDEGNLRRAAACLAGHLQAGGLVIVEPWVTPGRFVSGRLVLDTVDDADLKVARVYVTERQGEVSIFDSSYVIGTPDGVASFRERQELGLFSDEVYRTALTDAGLDIVDASGDIFGYGLYVCRGRA
jgi:dTDP-3-amino-3,4,6-trideoxy-alpha-D-glucopyranose N,N-dimethyltransferase